jgi:hypothetical protein
VKPSPYKFLASYGEDDHDRFFGREIETDVLLADVVVSRLVVLFAKTGTGKTSLINAGVRPLLKERGYSTYFIRVREDPFDEARSVLRKQTGKRFPRHKPFADQLRGLARDLEQPVVLFFDQFEEFFLYLVAKDVARAEQFVGEIADLYDDRDSGVHVVFSMREEWFVEMGFFRDRIPAIFHNEANLRLRWFDRRQARDAIVKPVGEGVYAPELVDRLIEELVETGRSVAGTPSPGDIEPAQLQIICDTLWHARAKGAITVAAYESLADPVRSELVAQQILDRRLVAEFEKLKTREELELLDRLLPELETESGTKRVREYGDLEEALLSAPGIRTDAAGIRRLLERLKEARLLDLVPRERGELVELTHDYLVLRLDQLRPAISLIWPRRALREGLKAYRESATLLASAVLPDVLARAGELGLDAESGELLLRSALGHLADVRPSLPALEDSGAPVWEIFAERIATGGDAERARAIETLTFVDSGDAYRVLRDALELPAAGSEVVRLVGRAPRSASVELLSEALRIPEVAPKARSALAELAKAGAPDVADGATAALRESFRAALADPAGAAAAVDELVQLDYPVSVDLLEEVAEREGPASVAQAALARLAGSTHASVASRARRLVFGRVERALDGGAAGPWCVELLEQIEDPISARLLGRLPPHLHTEAKQALETLKQSEVAEVAAAAAKELDRLAGHAPPEPRRPEPMPGPLPVRPPVSALDAHYNAVLRFLANGRVVPFLGAGINVFGRPPDVAWEPGRYPPSAAEVSQHLREYAYYPTEEWADLLRVSQYLAAVLGRRVLYQELRHLFDSDYPPSDLHRLLARLPGIFRSQGRAGSPRVIATTTYDDRLERAFADVGEPFDVLTYLADGQDAGRFVHQRPDGERVVIMEANRYADVWPDSRTVILKLHGGVDRTNSDNDSFVITEDDYLDYVTRAADPVQFLPVTVGEILRRSAFLFLGYALRDWNLRVLLRALWGAQPISYKSWAVQLQPPEVEVRLWQERDVDIIDLRLEDYVAGLEVRLSEFDVAAVPT